MGKMFNFQFPIFSQFSISKFSNRPLLKLVFIAVVCVILGGIVGLVLNYQTLKELRSEEIETALPVVAEEEEKIATYSGTIKPSVYSKGTHYLEDDGGSVIVLLKGGEIESGFLELLEGRRVEVVGRIEEAVEEGFDLLEVNEVHL